MLLRLTTALFIAAVLAGTSGGARASFTTCSFDLAAHKVHLVSDASTGSFVSVGADGAIVADGSPCAGATVLNTDRIEITSTGDSPAIGIDLSGGPFAPGFTDEPGGSDEIEFSLALTGNPLLAVAGGPSKDFLVAGTGGINLNAAELDPDPDIELLLGGYSLTLAGRDGNDLLSSAGGSGTGAGYLLPATLVGGGESDTLVGGPAANLIDGGPAGDSIVCGGGSDRLLYTGDTGGVFVDLGARPGPIFARGEAAGDRNPTDDCEDLSGGSGNDVLLGDDGVNTIVGNGGHDVMVGRAGSDRFFADDDLRDVVLGGRGFDVADADLAGDGSPTTDFVVGVEATS